MLWKERPCRSCSRVVCCWPECAQWEVWFQEAWAAVNRYAWQLQDEQGRAEPEKFQYELPHMVRSPCRDCPCGEWCDVPCSKRLKWWDQRVKK